MKERIHRITKVFLLLALTVEAGILSGQGTDLRAGFVNPPAKYSILPFWSWNGTLEKEKLTWQLEQMKAKGIDGAFIHARAGLDESETPYFSKGFWNAVDATVEWSADNNFNTYLYDEDKWPSGSAGGRTLQIDREAYIKKGLRYETMDVKGPIKIDIQLTGTVVGVFAARIIGEKQIDPQSIIDITGLGDGSRSVPEGKWLVISFEQFNDPGEQIDYLDKQAVEAFFSTTHEEYASRYGKYFGSVIPGIFFDEIYATTKQSNSLVWTDDFLQQFKALKGYDLKDKLPLLIYDGGKESIKVNNDYFSVFTQLYLEAWFKPYHDWCEAHNIWVTGHTEEGYENYLTQGDYFRTMGQLQVPGTDNEYFRYGHPRIISWRKPKQISSIAHIYGRERSMAEAMGGGGYIIPLEEYRYGMAMLGAYGVNMFIPHLFHYEFNTPITKADWPPSWFYRNPYWKYFKPLADYGKRISYMISQGHHVCDIAILYPITSKYADGYSVKYDDRVYEELQGSLLKNQYDFDLVDPFSINQAKATDQGLEIRGETYKMLILPQLSALKAATAKKIREFVEKGGMVLSVADIPNFSPEGLEESAEVFSVMKELFNIDPDRIYRRIYNMDDERKHYYNSREYPSGGKAIFTQYLWEVPSILSTFLDADIRVQSNTEAGLKFVHRRTESEEFYLLVNEARTDGTFRVSIRGEAVPELWDPETGFTEKVHNYRWKEDRTELVLKLAPWEAKIVVLRQEEGHPLKSLITKSDIELSAIKQENGTLSITGWGKAGANHTISWEEAGVVREQNWPGMAGKDEINLDGPWDFVLSQNELDELWSEKLSQSEMPLQVMQFQWLEKPVDDPKALSEDKWKWVRVKEEFSKLQGAERHISTWDALWINHFDHTKKLEKPQVWFRKAFEVEEAVKSAEVNITADETYELWLNGTRIGWDADQKTVESFELASMLKQGKNEMEILVNSSQGLLAQLDIVANSGKVLTVRTDGNWEASTDRYTYAPAFVVASPPIGKWGDIQRPGKSIRYPIQLWYRVTLAPGAATIIKPEIKGDYELYINGRQIEKSFSRGQLELRSFLGEGENTLELSVLINAPDEGLQEPLTITCRSAKMPLGSWMDHGLWWYSGRGIYKKQVNIDEAYIDKDIRLDLDLGEVAHFAEVWINGQLVKYFPWGPFVVDITQYVKPGKNDVTIITANLLANKALWDIPDANLNDENSRWWHHGRPRQEPERLRSGLIGPVKIVPYVLESITLGE